MFVIGAFFGLRRGVGEKWQVDNFLGHFCLLGNEKKYPESRGCSRGRRGVWASVSAGGFRGYGGWRELQLVQYGRFGHIGRVGSHDAFGYRHFQFFEVFLPVFGQAALLVAPVHGR